MGGLCVACTVGDWVADGVDVDVGIGVGVAVVDGDGVGVSVVNVAVGVEVSVDIVVGVVVNVGDAAVVEVAVAVGMTAIDVAVGADPQAASTIGIRHAIRLPILENRDLIVFRLRSSGLVCSSISEVPVEIKELVPSPLAIGPR